MELKEIVTTRETSDLLNSAGYSEKAMFSYFMDKKGLIYLSETVSDQDEFIAFAYTSSELIDSLPAYFYPDSSTFIVKDREYRNPTQEEIEKYDYVELVSIKIPEHVVPEGQQYLTKYCLNNVVIAFSQNEEGFYNNLICFGPSEAESRAHMILQLLRDGKM